MNSLMVKVLGRAEPLLPVEGVEGVVFSAGLEGVAG